MKILILYFSGVGATKKIAEMMASSLSDHEVKLYSVEEKVFKDFSCYDALIVGTPTYHASPAQFLMDYIDAIPVQNQQLPTFVFNTKGLASCETNRILAKKLLSKNLITIYEADYLAPASDGSLFVPQIKRFFKFEKDVGLKVIRDCTHFLQSVHAQQLLHTQEDKVTAKIPPIRFSTFINAPNKFGSSFVKMNIHLHQDTCIKCNLCIKGCPYDAFTISEALFPVVIKDKCTNCYRCIHHCPTQALSLFKKKKHKRVLKY